MAEELNKEQLDIIEAENSTLEGVLSSLNRQREENLTRLSRESGRARTLTESLVGTRRAEDKQLLASDEAVAHALKDKHRDQESAYTKLLKKPYFARIVLEDETADGDIRELEYKIGTIANPECRIIDWRKAPLSKLYYQYREGDEYSEVIQGVERLGIVKTRTRVEIDNAKLLAIGSSKGEFINEGGNWRLKSLPQGRTGQGSYARLPSIFSLITAEQFRLITDEAKNAVLIQGVAGSGKTAVALHRLSWLLHENNSDIKAEETLIVVKSPLLKKYIEASLPLLELSSVEVKLIDNFNPTRTYRAAVIDEVQDVSKAEIDKVLGAIKNTDFLTLVGDVAQQISEDTVFAGWDYLSNKVSATGRLFVLEISYRSTLQIMNLARSVRGETLLSKGRNGRVPIWFKCEGETQGIRSAIDWLKLALEKYSHSLSAVLCKDLEQAKYVYSLLKPTFGDQIRLLNQNDFSLEDGLVVAPIYDVKGLEFTNVLIWNPDSKSYPNSIRSKNLLYVAITRAEENLCIASWHTACEALSETKQPLVRIVDLRLDQ